MASLLGPIKKKPTRTAVVMQNPRHRPLRLVSQRARGHLRAVLPWLRSPPSPSLRVPGSAEPRQGGSGHIHAAPVSPLRRRRAPAATEHGAGGSRRVFPGGGGDGKKGKKKKKKSKGGGRGRAEGSRGRAPRMGWDMGWDGMKGRDSACGAGSASPRGAGVTRAELGRERLLGE